MWGSNTLWSESSPGAGDYAAFEAGPGKAIRFYGNRCRHYTLENETDGTRVSFDFRVIPRHLFVPPNALASSLSRHALNPGDSKRGYYEDTSTSSASPADVARQRRAWRDGGVSVPLDFGRSHPASGSARSVLPASGSGLSGA